MAFDAGLAERIRDLLRNHRGITERKMFGGLAFMLDGHMFVGIIGDTLMARARQVVGDLATFNYVYSDRATLSTTFVTQH